MNHPGAPPRAHALSDVPKTKDYPVLLRGEVQNTGPIVPRRFLAVLSPDPAKRPEWKQGSGRLELAQAIADPKNPLTARALVNRIWQQHFGTGFIGTPDNLGNMGGTPSHPELLDWLATQFIAQGWSIKQLQRTILLSSTYQQGSQPNAAGLAADPDNHLLWHYAVHRLDFEEIYDSLLAIAGTLDPGDRRPARHAGQRRLWYSPRPLLSHRPPQPARIAHAIRFSQPRHGIRQALRHHRAAAGVVPDEQPARHRDCAQAHAPPGVQPL